MKKVILSFCTLFTLILSSCSNGNKNSEEERQELSSIMATKISKFNYNGHSYLKYKDYT